MKKIIAFVLALVLSLALVACGGANKQPAIDAFNKTSTAFNEVAAFINADIEAYDPDDVATLTELANVLKQHAELLSGNTEISEEQLDEMIAWYAEVDEWVAAMRTALDIE